MLKSFFQTNKKEKIVFLLILIIACFILFYQLGSAPVQSWDEGFYALMAQDAGHLGLIPSLHSVPWLEKPPLGIWLIALCFKIFGFTAFALRLPSALFALVSIIFLFFLGKKISGLWLGFFSFLLLLFSPMFLYPHHMLRTGDLDTMLLCATVGAFLFYLMSWKKPAFLLLSGAMVGLGLMLRGTPMLMMAGVIVLHALLTRKKIIIPLRFWIWSLMVAVIIALPWHLYVYLLYGKDFIASYFSAGLLQRIFGVIDSHTGPFSFYHNFLQTRFGLFLPLGYLSMIWLFYKGIKNKAEYLLIALWFIVPFLAISSMKTKLFWYLMPLLPAFFLALTIFVKDLIQGHSKKLQIVFLGLLSFFWLIDLPHNVAGWGLKNRILMLVLFLAIALLILKIKLFSHKIIYSPAAVFISLMIVLIGANGAQFAWRTVFSRPIEKPSIEKMAEKMKIEKINNPLVLIKQAEWIRGWLNPQVEWYLNIKNSLGAKYINFENIKSEFNQKQKIWLVTDESSLKLLNSFSADFKFDIYTKVDNLLLVSNK